MASKQRYAKEFPYADYKRWYIELVAHDKIEWNKQEAWDKHLITFDTKEEAVDYHDFSGCYLETLREQGEYERSKQGRIDLLRDEINELQESIQQCRKGYAIARSKGWQAMMDFENEYASWLKSRIADNQRQIIKIMTGRK